jgi:hypothetical protein
MSSDKIGLCLNVGYKSLNKLNILVFLRLMAENMSNSYLCS